MLKELCNNAVKQLKAKENTTHCKDLIAVMESLGFKVKAGSKGNHFTFKHPEVIEIRGSFDGRHGIDAVIKPCYVRDVIKAINALNLAKSKTLENDNE